MDCSLVQFEFFSILKLPQSVHLHMEMTITAPLISRLRKSNWSRAFVFLLTLNFINLSANFYEGNILISGAVDMNDPLDTITELIFEWALEGGDDLIPDNGTQQDDNSSEKIKLALLEIPLLELFSPILTLKNTDSSNPDTLVIGYSSIPVPPPDRC
jgi:hypothetical protein